MKRSGFLLGLFSIGGQVLLLRELISTFNGDELFIGTALFGWMLAVALGAFIGGRRGRAVDRSLFIAGALVLPALIIVIRLAPLGLTDYIGEIIPFVKAALFSIVAMAPVGILSGWLFSVIVQKEGTSPAGSIGTVYLFEGLGAFAGGIIISVMAGGPISTQGLSLMLTLIIVTAALDLQKTFYRIASWILFFMLAAAVYFITPPIDTCLDTVKYRGYDVRASFDTHYSHQTILGLDESVILMTNGTVETIYPDRERVENILIPPLLYKPDARNVLIIGRAETGVAYLADSLGLQLTAVDPRQELGNYLETILTYPSGSVKIADDPLRFLSSGVLSGHFDIIIVAGGQPDNYQNSRLFTDRFFSVAGKYLSDDGIIYLPTGYDTDRHITSEKEAIISIIHQTLSQVYINLETWPGNMTLFFASPLRKLDLPFDSLLARISRLEINTVYIHPDYLLDRLNQLKTERLDQTLGSGTRINTVEFPILPHYQAMYRSLTDSFDRKFLGAVLQYPFWVVVIPVGLFLVLVTSVLRNRDTNQFALFLYFVAGLVSLTLELVAFYLFQTTAGSLYSEMAILIGAFMLGLSLGTYYSLRCSPTRPLELPALILLLAAGLILIGSWKLVGPAAALPYYALFLFVAALATGTLFIGATNRYYTANWKAHRGSGYGWEILGSSLGALFTTTIILPVIGLSWLLWSLIILTGLTFLGAVATSRG